MDGLEEEMLHQMVHDFIESEPPASPNSIGASSLNQPTGMILKEILGRPTEAEKEVMERAMEYVKEMGEERRKSSTVKKRLMMRLRNHGYHASLVRSSWVATMDCPAGDYEYIDIVMGGEGKEGAGAATRLIVDIDFKSQFEVARATLSYTQVSSTLPTIFVGNEEKLKVVVSLLSSAAQQSLRESGLHIPPWRRSTYMQSKWLSCCHKVSTIPLHSSIECSSSSSNGGERERRRNGARHKGSGLSSQFSDLTVNCC